MLRKLRRRMGLENSTQLEIAIEIFLGWIRISLGIVPSFIFGRNLAIKRHYVRSQNRSSSLGNHLKMRNGNEVASRLVVLELSATEWASMMWLDLISTCIKRRFRRKAFSSDEIHYQFKDTEVWYFTRNCKKIRGESFLEKECLNKSMTQKC